jgi:deoxyadenosine/deoxycytidine kinase
LNILNTNTNVNYIAVEGVIGAGKTSLANLLAQKLNAKLILENFEDNPYLEKFYQNPAEFAFRTQLFFLLERFNQLQQLNQKELFHNFIVSDYIFEKDKIFAYLNLNDEELKIYEQITKFLDKSIITPDLVIYLQTSEQKLISNIKKRNRDIEKFISEDYISNLNEAYNYFFSRYKASKIFIINADESDFENNPEDLNNLINEIFNTELSAVKYFNPSLRKSAGK